jgi:hypothetical protein
MIMTQDKALKTAIRARMAETGEPYNVARRIVLAEGDVPGEPDQPQANGHDMQEPQADGRDTQEPQPPEDYNARYLREAELAGVPAYAAQASLAADRAQEAADQAQLAADLAQERADQAEEAAEQAEERADLAHESARLAEEWEAPGELARTRLRSAAAREGAEHAREAADRA